MITDVLKDAISDITYQIQSNAVKDKLEKKDIVTLNDSHGHLELSDDDWTNLFILVKKAIKIASKSKINKMEEAFLEKMMLTCLVIFQCYVKRLTVFQIFKVSFFKNIFRQQREDVVLL